PSKPATPAALKFYDMGPNYVFGNYKAGRLTGGIAGLEHERMFYDVLVKDIKYHVDFFFGHDNPDNLNLVYKIVIEGKGLESYEESILAFKAEMNEIDSTVSVVGYTSRLYNEKLGERYYVVPDYLWPDVFLLDPTLIPSSITEYWEVGSKRFAMETIKASFSHEDNLIVIELKCFYE
ncbi:MAG: hypothetical protein NC403_08875, partial [Muribaculaceae bacterium]|nr:hypothetical protein [Muribaculaceae bacterium]